MQKRTRPVLTYRADLDIPEIEVGARENAWRAWFRMRALHPRLPAPEIIAGESGSAILAWTVRDGRVFLAFLERVQSLTFWGDDTTRMFATPEEAARFMRTG